MPGNGVAKPVTCDQTFNDMDPRNTQELLEKLSSRVRQTITAAKQLAALPDAQLQQKPHPKAWNALECLAHLNHYGDFYHPEIRRRIETSKHKTPQATYTSSWLGNKFAAGMKPGPKTRKVKTFKNANPINFTTPADRSVINTFLNQQQEMLDLLELAKTVDLTRTKTSTSISRFLKLRLADTFRTMVYHDWRHVEQARRAAGLEL